MKKLFILLVFAVVATAFTAKAQTTVSTSKVFTVNRQTNTGKDTAQHNYFYVANYATKFKVQAYLYNYSGYGKVKVVLRTSMDYVKWTRADSVTVTEASTKAISTLLSPYTPYLDVEVVPIDSTQKSSATLTILIEKNQ